MVSDKTALFGTLGIVATVAVVGLITLMNTAPDTVARPSPTNGNIDGNAVGQAYSQPGAGYERPVEPPVDDIPEKKQKFIQQNQEQIRECNKIVDNKYTTQQLSMQKLQQDREFQGCVKEIAPDAKVSSVSVSSGSRIGKQMEVVICIDTTTVVGTVCSDTVNDVLEAIGVK